MVRVNLRARRGDGRKFARGTEGRKDKGLSGVGGLGLNSHVVVVVNVG